MLLMIIALCCSAGAAEPAPPSAVTEDKPDILKGDFGVEGLFGFERGDYGTGDTVSVTTLSARVLYTWSYGEARLTVPLVWISGRKSDSGAGTVYGGYGPPLTGEGDDDAAGFGDVRLETDLRLFGEPSEGFYGGPTFGVKFPTADEDEGLGTGEFDWTLGGHVAYTVDRHTPFARLTCTFIGDPPGVNYRDPWSLVLGSVYRADENNSFTPFIEVKESVERGRDDSATLFFSWRRELSNNLYFMLIPYVGLSDEAPDYGLSMGLGIRF
jgi:hypothetical protein